MADGKDETMTLKWLGAILVVAGCGGLGFTIALYYRREISCLKQMVSAIEFMHSQLQYRLTPLPELYKQVSQRHTGCIKDVFLQLSQELECQISPDAESCAKAAIAKTPNIPKYSENALTELGKSMGIFDLNGQLQALESVSDRCKEQLSELQENRVQRIRSYQTLGLCAGAALAILFI